MYSAGVTGHDVTPFIFQFFDVDVYCLLFTCKSKSCQTKRKRKLFRGLQK